MLLFLGSLTLYAQSDATVSVTAPAGAEMDIEAIQSVFGPEDFTDPVSGPVVEGVDTSGLALACGSVANDLTGAIALIDRGECNFFEKAANAEAAGAAGVIVCNTEFRVGVYQPYKAVIMGPTNPGAIGIPVVMIPYQQCSEMRLNLTNGLEATISPTVLPVDPGETCEVAIEIGPGTYTVDPLTGGYGGRQLFQDVSNTAWYSYTPASDHYVTVRSCGLSPADTDTRLYIFTGTDCSFTDLTIIAENDDCGIMDFPSEASFLARAGTRYWIYWDDRWDFSGFEFELVEETLPEVNVTFTVDMANEVVGGDGVNMVWAFSDAATVDDVNVVALTSNGDNTWSGTVALTALDTIGYAFMNGALDLANIESVPDVCGLPSGFGFEIRPLIVNANTDFELDKVCFSTCEGECPPLECAAPPVLFENLDNYTAGGYVGQQSSVWTTWSNLPGSSEDAFVSGEQAFSPPHSVKAEGQDGPTDLVLDLGQQTEGNWYLAFKMYIPSGRYAYYNIQDDLPFNYTQWNLEADFNAGGNGQIIENQAAVAGFSFPHDAWFDVVHRIDLDNDKASLAIDGVNVWNWEYGPDFKIGSFNFFPNNNGPNLFYIDDIVLRPLGPCPEGAIICDGFEAYSQGPVSAQSADWAPRAGSPADDGVVVSLEEGTGPARTGCQSLKISADGPDSQLLLLGDRTEGNYLLEWYMYVPAGSLGYYNTQKYQDDPGSELGMQVEWFADGAATVDAGGAGVATFNWTPGAWMHFQHFIDLDNNWITFMVDGLVIYEFPANATPTATTGVTQIGSVEFYGHTDVLFYLDDVLFQELPPRPGNLCGGAIGLQSLLGQGQGNTVSAGPYDNTNYTSTRQDPNFGWECFGEPDGTGANPTLERTTWFTFTGDGNTYLIEARGCGDDPIDLDDTQMAIYSGSCGNLTALACNEDFNSGGAQFYSSLELQTEEGTTFYIMIDGFGPDSEAEGGFCVEFTQQNLGLVTVTLNVDMSEVDMVSPEGVHVAGNFQGWDPAATPMDDNGDGTWSVSFPVDPNQTLEYKFLNGDEFGTDEMNITEDCGVDGGAGSFNRVLEVGDENISTPFYCFDYCVTCDLLDAVDDVALQSGVAVFPNPARSRLNVRLNLPEPAVNLSVRLLNAFGQAVVERQYGALKNADIEISLAGLPAGVYLLQVRDGEAQFTQPVVKE